MNKILCLFILFISFSVSYGQTLEELKAAKKEKKDSIGAIQSRVDALQKQIDNYPGWKFGAFGTVGGSLSEFNNWYAQGIPNNSSGKLGITINPYARLDAEKYFWYTAGQINLGWVKLDDLDDPTDNDSFRATTDVFNIQSLFGYNLSSKIASSFLMEYRTTLIDNFNDPGYLDVGIGFTWKPVNDLVVVVHPLNYNFVFSSTENVFESSAGTKIVANYGTKFGGLSLKSNLSSFISYYSSNLSNWTRIISLSYKLWKGIGAGFEFGLRNNKQEALSYAREELENPDATFDNIDNELQTYWLLGITYEF
ncbi:MAG: DUF3078 domain-containing protein [Cyclobacteriaceae bacterium]